jgi:putative NADPH-quinone reductase
MAELLRPLEVTAHLSGLDLAEPLVLHSVSKVRPEELAAHAARYRELLAAPLASTGRKYARRPGGNRTQD